LIAQIWRGQTRASDREASVAQLLKGIQTALVGCATCKGVYLLTRPTGDTDVELMVLSLFGAATASACHDGEALYRAAAFDRQLPFVFDKRVAVYEVSTGSRRALSYANLQRRFPLRLMAPR
jgi:hypothetical protein